MSLMSTQIQSNLLHFPLSINRCPIRTCSHFNSIVRPMSLNYNPTQRLPSSQVVESSNATQSLPTSTILSIRLIKSPNAIQSLLDLSTPLQHTRQNARKTLHSIANVATNFQHSQSTQDSAPLTSHSLQRSIKRRRKHSKKAPASFDDSNSASDTDPVIKKPKSTLCTAKEKPLVANAPEND